MDMASYSLVILLVIGAASLATSDEPKHTEEYYLDRCLDGILHKAEPGPESDLFSQCQPWKNRSCCTPETTNGLHVNPTWHNFNWNHCPQPLSTTCEQWMRQDLCFYECSPNVGPWLVPHNISIRNERFMHVPLCESECNVWFEACRNDFTCKENWAKGWNWQSGENECPADTTCQTFETMYGSAKNMCEKIWNHSYKVVPDTESCMVLWFEASRGNPNEEVAQEKAKELASSSASPGPRWSRDARLGLMTLAGVLSAVAVIWKQPS